MAGEHVRWDVEVRLAHSVDLVHTSCRDGFYTVHRTGNELRVIEDIKEVRSQLEPLAAFTDGEVLED